MEGLFTAYQHCFAATKKCRVNTKTFQVSVWNGPYLRHVVGNGLVKPEEHIVNVMQEAVPQKNVQTFLGLMNIIGGPYLIIQLHCTDLSKKASSNAVVWTDNC